MSVTRMTWVRAHSSNKFRFDRNGILIRNHKFGFTFVQKLHDNLSGLISQSEHLEKKVRRNFFAQPLHYLIKSEPACIYLGICLNPFLCFLLKARDHLYFCFEGHLFDFSNCSVTVFGLVFWLIIFWIIFVQNIFLSF